MGLGLLPGRLAAHLRPGHLGNLKAVKQLVRAHLTPAAQAPEPGLAGAALQLAGLGPVLAAHAKVLSQIEPARPESGLGAASVQAPGPLAAHAL